MSNEVAPPARNWRVALIGCGRISVYHIMALRDIPGIDIVGVCDLDGGAARDCATKYGIRGCYTDAELMLQEVRPDAVHILTPPQSHVALARLAARYQAHMYIEKPLASSSADARLILDLARQASVQVCPGHSRLYDPVFIEACRRVRLGQIGRVVSVRAEQGFSYEAAAHSSVIPWSYSYDWGIFDNLICHPLYLVCHFLRNPGTPRVVGLNLGTVREAGVEEIRVLIPSDNGIGEVSLSLCTTPEVNRMELVGTRGRITADWQTMTVLTTRKTGLPSAVSRLTQNFSTAAALARSGLDTLVGIFSGKVKRYQGLRTIVEQFHQALRSGAASPVSPEQGLLNIGLMDAIKDATEAVRKTRPSNRSEYTEGIRPRILVTGATGFLGGRLIEVLSSQGTSVRATTRLLSRARELPNVQWVECDLADEARMRDALCDIETVYHCAALCGAPGTLEDYQHVNVGGTERLLRLATECGVRNFVYLSSMSVYAAPADPAATLDESAPLESRAPERGSYTQSKLAAETAVLDYARLHRFPRIVVLRPGTLYGPGTKLPMGRFQLPSSSQRPLIAGSRRIPAGLVYVDDVIEAMLAAARTVLPSGSVYNLVETRDDQEELARTLQQVSEGRIRPVFLPYPLVWTAMLGVDLVSLVRRRKLGTARYRLHRTLAPMRFDCRAAERDLGWRPQVPLVLGLSRTMLHQSESTAGV